MLGRRCQARLVAAAMCAIVSSTVGAVQIEATFAELSGGSWQADYRVVNDNLPELGEFTIFFATSYTHSLVVATSPAGWDMLVAQPDVSIPDDGFVDGLAQAAGLPLGAALEPFRVTFGTSGQFMVAPQRFEIREPATFALVESGFTSVTVVPEPIPAALLLAGLLVMTLWRRISQR